jgi:hypothetical protein
VKLFTKALRLDGRFFVALFQALGRIPEAARARRREKDATRKDLRAAFAEIGRGWPPAVKLLSGSV